MAQGAGYGVLTLMRPTSVREVLGQERFGAKAGAVAAPGLFAFALAPALGAGVADAFGYGAMIWLAFVAPLVGIACLAATPRQKSDAF
jgi:MFS family permease